MPLRAVDVLGKDYYAEDCDESVRGMCLKCPVCDGRMVFVNPTMNIIKHFRHEVTCPYLDRYEPETEEHLEMKKFFFEEIPKFNRVSMIKTEFSVAGNVADVYFEKSDSLQNLFKIAVECQVSYLTMKSVRERTARYNKSGIHVLWVLHDKNFFNRNMRSAEDWLRKHYYGRIYGIKDGVFVAMHPKRDSRILETRWGEEYEKFYKRMVGWSFNPVSNLSILATSLNGVRIARFYDKRFWEVEAENWQIFEDPRLEK
jgi:competence CoiA-like predicted nuclease